MSHGKVSIELIDLVPHYKESPLVQKAVHDMGEILARKQEQEISPKQAQIPEQKKSSTRQSVLAALRNRQTKMKEQEQREQKTAQKAEQKSQRHGKGEVEV